MHYNKIIEVTKDLDGTADAVKDPIDDIKLHAMEESSSSLLL